VPAAAEIQLKPFVAFTFGGTTTFVNSRVAGDKKFAVGISGLTLGEIFGVEADVGRTPGFFSDGHLVVTSSVTTITGNAVVALPRRLARYTLRPYAIVGPGVMNTHIDYASSLLPDVTRNMAVIDVGGGVTGFITDRVGVNWDVRHFGSVGGSDHRLGQSLGLPEQLSFWRVSMGIVIR